MLGQMARKRLSQQQSLKLKDLLIFETTEGNNHSWFVLQSILKSGWNL